MYLYDFLSKQNVPENQRPMATQGPINAGTYWIKY